MVDFDEPQLNKEQKQAVEHGTGPLLIIAGAGTGNFPWEKLTKPVPTFNFEQ